MEQTWSDALPLEGTGCDGRRRRPRRQPSPLRVVPTTCRTRLVASDARGRRRSEVNGELSGEAALRPLPRALPQRGRAQHSRVFAAKAFLATVDADLVRGQWIDPRGGQILFSDWVRTWSAARVVRESTTRTDDGRIRAHLMPTFGTQQLRAITPITVRTWVAALCERRAPKTVRHCHALLSKILGDAVLEGLIVANPCQGTRMPTPGESIARFLAPAEIEALVQSTLATTGHW